MWKKFGKRYGKILAAAAFLTVAGLCYGFAKTDGETATLEVTLFTKQADGSYKRQDESHVQYVHTEEEIAEALQQAGFQLLAIEGHLGEEKETSDRLMFIACKQ